MCIGAWRVERELGRGGMATVYEVTHTQFGKRAALKLAHCAIDSRRLTRGAFLREARASNLIHHAGVTEVFATGTYDRRPYLAMEVLSGRSLAERLDDSLPRDEALEIVIELCEVLAAAHAAGVTHRDLKLDNVLLLDAPGAFGRRTKLLDWGMARIAGEHDPLRHLIAGTLTYVAPEQLRGDDITPAADVYALAVLAYRLLLGHPPFTSPSDLELIQQHLHGEPPRPRTQWNQTPPALETTLLAMLAKQPEDRPALPEIVHVLGDALAQFRAERLRPQRRPPASSNHGIGRLTFRSLGHRSMLRVPLGLRLVGAALGVALTALGLIQLLSA
jgi:serine/threonine protein kinase